MQGMRTWAWRLLIVLLASIWLTLMGFAWAESVQAADEYSFNWLDPDKKIYVLQNRRYTKALRPMISATGGVGLSNPFRNTYNIDPKVAFFFTEALGIEVFYTVTFNVQNSTAQAILNTGTGTYPVVREITGMAGGLFHWIPWYAKINVFNAILYFDWYFAAGGGAIISTAINPSTGGTSVGQTLPAAFLSTGHMYHLSKYFLIRLDFSAAIYPAPVFGTSGPSSIFTNYNLGLGVGVKI